jgi:hypothetical protein
VYSDTFNGCSSLANISIPSNITYLETRSFKECTALEYIDLTAYGADKAFPFLSNVNVFESCGTATAGTFQIRVPSGRKAELATMTNWSTYADNIVEV